MQLNNIYYLSALGVVGDGATDDTAALNAAFALAAGQGATFIWNGKCKITDTVVIGANTGNDGAGPASSLNIICPRGSNFDGVNWAGPDDGRPAILFANNRYFYVRGLGVNNHTTKVAAVGMVLGGDGGPPGADPGTETLAATFCDVTVSGFNVGISDGNAGDSSEIHWDNLHLYNNNIGWTCTGADTLDHIFTELSLGNNGIGIKTGATEAVHVYGGSCSGSLIASFSINGIAALSLIGYRDEASVCTVQGGRDIYIARCSFEAGTGPAITGQIDRLHLISSRLDTAIVLYPFQTMTIEDCRLSGCDLSSELPVNFVGITQASYSTYCLFKNNIDTPSGTALPDFEGDIISSAENNQILFEPSLLFIKNPNLSQNPSPLGVSTLALSHVKQLSEASVPSALTAGSPVTVPAPGQNLRVSGTFQSSGTLQLNFVRSLFGNSGNGQSNRIALTQGLFLPSDAGKPVTMLGAAPRKADWNGYITKVIDPTHAIVQGCNGMPYPYAPAFGADPLPAGGVVTSIGIGEPDASYIVVGIVGNSPIPETYSVSAQTANGFTVRSSNPNSTATVNCLLVR